MILNFAAGFAVYQHRFHQKRCWGNGLCASPVVQKRYLPSVHNTTMLVPSPSRVSSSPAADCALPTEERV